MFIECFSGLMGGGKSFFSTVRAAQHIASGGLVVSNIHFELEPWFNDAYADKMTPFRLPTRFEGCRKQINPDLTVSDVIEIVNGVPHFVYNSKGLKHYLKREHGWTYQEGQFRYLPDEQVNVYLHQHIPRGSVGLPVLVILDEALDKFESNGTTSNSTAEFRSFLRHVRKLGVSLIFIAQDFESLDKKIRMLTHFVWRFRDLLTWPLPVINRPFPPPFCHYIVCQQYHQSQFGSLKAKTINSKTWFPRDSDVFGCYQSVSLHNVRLKMADDSKTDFRLTTKKKAKTVYLIERLFIYSVLGFLLWSYFWPSEPKKVPDPVSKTVPSPDRVVPSVPVKEPPPPVVRVVEPTVTLVNGRGEVVRVIVENKEIEYFPPLKMPQGGLFYTVTEKSGGGLPVIALAGS